MIHVIFYSLASFFLGTLIPIIFTDHELYTQGGKAFLVVSFIFSSVAAVISSLDFSKTDD